MKFIFTDRDDHFQDEYQEASLKEQTAWWTPNGSIIVYTLVHNTFLKRWGAAGHEGLEYLLIHKSWLPRKLLKRKQTKTLWSIYCNLCHYESNVLECFLSLFTAVILWDEDAALYWAPQKWDV